MKKISIITMLLVVLTLFASVVTTTAAPLLDNDERQITLSELPAAAQQFINKHFSNELPSLVVLDKGLVSNEYDVVFESGTKLEFNGEGEWSEIKCRTSAVPSDLVPKKIADYVAKKYPDTKIVELKREYREWEAKLSNGLELTFDKQFKLIDIDN